MVTRNQKTIIDTHQKEKGIQIFSVTKDSHEISQESKRKEQKIAKTTRKQ